MGRYLDKTGLTYLWSKIKAAFVKKSGDTMTGTLTLTSGNVDVQRGNLWVGGDVNYRGITIKGASGSPALHIRNTGVRLTLDQYVNGSTGGERYLLPMPETRSADVWYGILTTKNVVTVDQGGTGAATLAGGQALIGNGTGAVQTRAITNVTSGAATASTNLVTANTLVSHVADKLGDYLPLTGGTMTGTISSNKVNPFKWVDDSNNIEKLSLWIISDSNATRYSFRQYRPSGTYRENFNLPDTTDDVTANTNYNILTTKTLNGVTGRTCRVGQSGSTTTKPWYKVATCAMSGNTDSIITFLVESTYGSHNYGILRVHVRSNSGVVDVGGSDIVWLANTGFSTGDFFLVCPTSTNPTVEIWTKVAAGYRFHRFTVLSEGDRTTAKSMWTLLTASSAGQAETITTDGTEIPSANSFVDEGSIAYTKEPIYAELNTIINGYCFGTESNSIRFRVTTPKSLKNISAVTVSYLSGRAVGVNGAIAIGGSASAKDWLTAANVTSVSANLVSNGTIIITVSVSTLTNADVGPVSFFGNLRLNLTY